MPPTGDYSLQHHFLAVRGANVTAASGYSMANFSVPTTIPSLPSRLAFFKPNIWPKVAVFGTVCLFAYIYQPVFRYIMSGPHMYPPELIVNCNSRLTKLVACSYDKISMIFAHLCSLFTTLWTSLRRTLLELFTNLLNTVCEIAARICRFSVDTVAFAHGQYTKIKNRIQIGFTWTIDIFNLLIRFVADLYRRMAEFSAFYG